MKKFNRRERGHSYANDMTMKLQDTPYRDLNTLKGINVQLTAENADSLVAEPYPIVNDKTNRVEVAKYAGKFNYAGNVLKILPNKADAAPVKSIDAMHIELLFKYMYLAINNQDKNIAANIQFGKAVNEAIAKVHSDIFTQLPFFQATITSRYMPTTESNGFGEALVWYQTMIQNVAIIISTYWNTLSLKKKMFQMGFNREYHAISSLMSYISKNSFKNTVRDLNTIIKDKYFDIPWFKQFNTIANGVARVKDDSRHPLMTITAAMEVPDISYSVGGTQIFSSDDYRISVDGNLVPFHQAVNKLCTLLSPYEIIKWARNTMMGTATLTFRQYGNLIQDYLDAVSLVLEPFSRHVGDIQTMLYTAKKGGLTNWADGIFIQEPVSGNDQREVTYNKLIADIYRNYMFTSFDLKWDDKTCEWTFKTPWCETFGFPDYDTKNGGAFITFSNHRLTIASGDSGKEQKYLVPILYNIDTSSAKVDVTAIDRDGREYQFFRISRTISKDPFLQRLNLLHEASFDTCMIPVCNIERSWSDLTDRYSLELSQVVYILQSVFGAGAITTYVPVTPGDYRDLDETEIKCEAVTTDLIGFVDVQLEDVTNDMIIFYQTYAPLKVYTNDTSRTIGFVDATTPTLK